MPIPKPETTPEPRRLLRDVALERLLAAIMDGTLDPGERLNDDELVNWLGVSRTPIREALARLAEWGLVEMEANRYTRIAPLDPKVYADAAQFLEGLHQLALAWAVDIAASEKKTISAHLKSARKSIVSKDPQGVRALLDAYGELAVATGNLLFAEAELPLRTRVKFLTPKSADELDWNHIIVMADTLSEALD